MKLLLTLHDINCRKLLAAPAARYSSRPICPKAPASDLGFLCGSDRLGRCKDVLHALTERGIGLH